MVSTATVIFGTSLFVFVLLLLVIRKERRRGRRFFLDGVRSWLDSGIDAVEAKLVTGWDHFTKYILQLHWYYSIHSVLKGFLRITVSVYTYFERILERNRDRAKQLRAEKRELGAVNHLRQMAEHKEGTALTAAQKKKLKHKKLEERH